MNGSDEAKQFLQDFLVRLMEANQTNQELIGTLSMQVSQQERMLQQQQRVLTKVTELVEALRQQSQSTNGANARLDGIAQRMDYLYEQMGLLGQAMLESRDEDSGGLPMIPSQGVPQSTAYPSLGQAAGQWIGDQFDQYLGGPQGGGGRHRRR